ncbi:uncharacterized protein LOC143847083 [Tasmannia lanceolata]|uniref:uncharacterized protein LOC143847083 n=1 Tax=Tasmannia lanceolata TaxID=3420 RepID=UPI0040641503
MSNSLSLLALSLLFYIVTVSASDSETPNSVHDLLPKFGLPKGLVPDSVTAYSLSDDGTFEIELSHSCYVQFDDLVYYSKKITGKLSYGSISDLSGIQAKKVFVWVSVTSIEMEEGSNEIEFHVGFLSEKLPVKQFESIPTCKNKALQESLRGVSSIAEV